VADILIAIPAFNEALTVVEVSRAIQKIPNSDIRVFDDGSTDGTVEKLISSEINFHSMMSNKGLAANFQVILQHFLSEGKYEWLITVDGDGQFNSLDIERIVREIKKGDRDFISGSRFLVKSNQKRVPWMRRVVNKLVARLITFLIGNRGKGRIVTDATCGLRAYSRNSAALLLGISGHSYTLDSIIRLVDSRLDIFEIPIEVDYFEGRKSAISGNLFAYGRYILEVFFSIIAVSSIKYIFKLLVTSLTLSIIILATFLVLSFRDGQFKGWLYLAGTGGFLALSTLVLLGIYTTIRQAKIGREFLDARVKLLFEVNNFISSQPSPQCKRCRNFL
jgi:glycosyltransferase involved in cell wall biosynthesis